MTVDGSARRDAVLRVAAELFCSRGYQGTSMDDIARGVGVNKGTLYHYVAGKSAILFEIYCAVQERALHSIQSIPAELAAEDALAELVRGHLRSMSDTPRETAVYFQEMRWIREWLTPEQAAVVRRNERTYIDLAADLVARSTHDGALPGTDPHVVAAGIVGMLAWTRHWFDARGPYSTDDVADVLVHLALDGLAARPAPAGDASHELEGDGRR